MELKEIAQKLGLAPAAGPSDLSAEVTGGYVSDLLSDVMAHSRKGDLWITLQTHQNIVAVADLKDHSGIVIVGGREPDQETVAKAASENIALFVTPLTAFELAGRLYQLGLRGGKDEEV